MILTLCNLQRLLDFINILAVFVKTLSVVIQPCFSSNLV